MKDKIEDKYLCKNMHFSKESPYNCSVCSGSDQHDNEAIKTLTELCDQYEAEPFPFKQSQSIEEKAREIIESSILISLLHPAGIHGFKEGATWMQAEKDKEIEEIREALKYVIKEAEITIEDAMRLHNSSNHSVECDGLENGCMEAKQLLKKYE